MMVKYKNLEDCCYLVKGKTPIQKAVPGQYPLVVTAAARKSCSTYQFDTPSVIIPLVSSRGHGVAALNQVYYQDGKFAVGNILCCVTPKDSNELDAKFLYYYLNYVKDWKLVPLMTGGANVSLKLPSLKKVQIPILPIDRQHQIVDWLDGLNEYAENIEQRIMLFEQQYEHAREKLLTFGEEVERKTLGEIFQIRGGYTPSTNNPDFWTEEGGFPWFKMEDIRDKGRFLSESYSHITAAAIKSNGLFPAGTIVFATSATIGEHAMLMVPALTNQRFTALIPKDDTINMKYIFYYGFIIDKWCKENTIQGSFAGVNMVGFRNYPIPLPSLSVQQSIVERLDKMESLIQNLQAERTLRQKQYEYYREKLLTFE